jgi:hypothetical protein
MSAARAPLPRAPLPFRDIRILIDEGERTVWKTFKGQTLAGTDNMGSPAGDSKGYWSVFRAASGKIVAVERPITFISAGRLHIFESIEAMRGKAPDRIVEQAEIAAGIRAAVEYPEEPLDV